MPRAKQDLNTYLIPMLDGPMTRSDLGLGKFHMKQLVADRLVKPVGTRPLAKLGKGGKPMTKIVNGEEVPVLRQGHPEIVYRATDKGRKRAKRIVAATA